MWRGVLRTDRFWRRRNDRGEGRGARVEGKCHGQKLSGPPHLATRYGVSGSRLRDDSQVACERIPWIDLSTATCRGFRSLEHCRGACTRVYEGIPAVFADFARISSRNRNPIVAIRTPATTLRRRHRALDEDF